MKFVEDHQRGIDEKIDKAFGKNSHYGKNMSKSGVTKPFKERFTKYIERENYFRQ
jgi:hypothetical protein